MFLVNQDPYFKIAEINKIENESKHFLTVVLNRTTRGLGDCPVSIKCPHNIDVLGQPSCMATHFGKGETRRPSRVMRIPGLSGKPDVIERIKESFPKRECKIEDIDPIDK